ncbi:hypothetical protein HPP92_020111 [Vanilla planifolia]|uniref:C2 domain-containing protein n=1 Tax=Vanilla planifolia TaxID=51239 RepID=A0A835Q724_VANPL|nr:hypothetical protein HPP92_020111 [Vanilla planifolia]
MRDRLRCVDRSIGNCRSLVPRTFLSSFIANALSLPSRPQRVRLPFAVCRLPLAACHSVYPIVSISADSICLPSLSHALSLFFSSLFPAMGGCCSGGSPGGWQAVGGDVGGAVNAFGGAGSKSADVAEAVEEFLKSRGLRSLVSQIELSLSASKLQDRDMLSKSDPMVVVYSKRRDGTLEEVGRTEVIPNTLNPVWIAKINVMYHFEMLQPLIFRLFDVDSQFYNVPEKMLKLDEQQFLGEASCLLSEDPFLLLSRTSESGPPIPICKSEVIKNDLNPTWKPVILNLQQVESKETPLHIECYNFNSNGKHDMIGKVVKSLAQLEKLHQNQNGEHLFVSTNTGPANSNKNLKGELFVQKFSESMRHTFLDYIAAGCEMNFMVAIDFTASNGNPRLSDSLHYIDPSGRPNAYQRAILDVAEVLQFYDSDKRFHAWGFGARPIDGPVSHCFNLNGSTNYPEVDGIQGIMSAYASALRNVSLAGPTLFGPVINNAATITRHSLTNNKQKYFVLLIITDGVITDLQETKDALVQASDLPLSILIVGVGGADFKEMEILDADRGEKLVSSSGQIATRDIVQFVPMREIQGGELSIVQALLAELPGQFMSYMISRDIKPLN